MDHISSVRYAVPADGDAIGRVHVLSWQATYRGVFPDEYLDALDVRARGRVWTERLIAANDRAGGCTLVVDEGGGVVGFAHIGADRDEPSAGVGELWAIYLQPDAVGRGLGRVLFARAVDELVAVGYRDAVLWVAEANDRARRFYERAGWAADGVIKSDTTSGVSVVEVRYRSRIAP